MTPITFYPTLRASQRRKYIFSVLSNRVLSVEEKLDMLAGDGYPIEEIIEIAEEILL